MKTTKTATIKKLDSINSRLTLIAAELKNMIGENPREGQEDIDDLEALTNLYTSLTELRMKFETTTDDLT